MLKKRPVLAGAVALAMSLTFLSGCGGDTVPTGDNGDTSGSTGSTTTTANAVSEIPGVAKTYQLAGTGEWHRSQNDGSSGAVV